MSLSAINVHDQSPPMPSPASHLRPPWMPAPTVPAPWNACWPRPTTALALTGLGQTRLVASEDSVTAGGVATLRPQPVPGARRHPHLELGHEGGVQLTTATTGCNGPLTKGQFIDDYDAAYRQRVGGHTVTTDDGQQVTLSVDLELVEAPAGLGGVRDMVRGSENWSIDVKRIPAGDFSQSYVTPSLNPAA